MKNMKWNVLFGALVLGVSFFVFSSSVFAADTDTSDTSTSTSSELPIGQDTLNYVRSDTPSLQLSQARNGEASIGNTVYPVDTGEVDYPNFWERVKQTILDALIQAFEDITGISIPTTT